MRLGALMLALSLLRGCPPPATNYWPLAVGNHWNYVSDKGLPLTISVEPSPAKFACINNPSYVLFKKTNLEGYWGPGFPANLNWFLVKDPNGDLRAIGHFGSNIADQSQDVGGTINYLTLDGTKKQVPPPLVAGSQNKAYLLIPGKVRAGTESYLQGYRNAGGENFSCIQQNTAGPDYTATWTVTYSFERVDTPAYKGLALKVVYGETIGNPPIYETWWFAPNVGVVKIDAHDNKDGVPKHVIVQLVSFQVH